LRCRRQQRPQQPGPVRRPPANGDHQGRRALTTRWTSAWSLPMGPLRLSDAWNQRPAPRRPLPRWPAARRREPPSGAPWTPSLPNPG